MKKQLTIEFPALWVFKHRGDEVLPIVYLKEQLKQVEGFEIVESTLTSLTVRYDAAIDLVLKMREILKKYDDLDYDGMCTFRDDGLVDGKKSVDKSEVDELEKLMEESVKPRCKALTEILNLVGAAEFKKLAEEVVKIAPELKRKNTRDVFVNRFYLFSIGDGCGLSTSLQLFSQLVNEVGLRKLNSRPPIEEKLGPYKESTEPFAAVERVFNNGNRDNVRVLCVDISEWMDRTWNKYFRDFLRLAEKHAGEFVIIFRVPFVDKDVLERIKFSISDLLSVTAVSFPPLDRSEIRECAAREISGYGFKITRTAWKFFDERISEEKSDGKFYGLNTVKKVVRELIYLKQLNNANKGKTDDVINANDARAICGGMQTPMTGEEQLKNLVGSEPIKKRIDEIVAQIELAVKENSADRPCIHMRFVGNPGTGKTTVARVIGKILKERGVLRSGNFFEYAGRDFCGRYIGETAPKTASICRDAYGSVLFIDEAYSLYRGDGNDRDFGREAIDTLIAEMENHRDDFVVIMAGYPDDMNKLMEGNAGLKSRMPYTIEFPNFTREQLYEIFASMVTSRFKHDDLILNLAHDYFLALSDEVINSKEFSNARYVRNLFERTWAKAAMRSQLDKKSGVCLTADDFERASNEKDFKFNLNKKTRIGF